MSRKGAVILNYCDSERTASLAVSLQSFGLLDDVIVVDNCSPDDSYNRLSTLASDVISVFQTSGNNGYSSGNNFGLAKANERGCEICVIANPDIVVSHDSLNAILDFMETHQEVSFAGAVVLKPDGARHAKQFWDVPNYADLLLSMLYFGRRIMSHRAPSKTVKGDYLEVEVLPGCFFAARMSTFEDVGYFDEGTFLYCEEDILAEKCKVKNYKLAYLPDVSYIHAHASSTAKTLGLYRSQKYLHRSQLYYARKYLNAGCFKSALFWLVSHISDAEFLLYGFMKSFKR